MTDQIPAIALPELGNTIIQARIGKSGQIETWHWYAFGYWRNLHTQQEITTAELQKRINEVYATQGLRYVELLPSGTSQAFTLRRIADRITELQRIGKKAMRDLTSEENDKWDSDPLTRFVMNTPPEALGTLISVLQHESSEILTAERELLR